MICTDLPVILKFHPSLTCTRDPETIELYHVRKSFSTDLGRESHLLLVENQGLGLGGADSQHSCFKQNCKLPPAHK